MVQALQYSTVLIERSPKRDEGFLLQGAAFLGLAKYTAAMKSSHIAEQITNAKGTGLTKADMLMDDIAYTAAQQGSFEGFDGRKLEASY